MINRSMSVADYKRSTLQDINTVTPNTMSTEQTPVTPQTTEVPTAAPVQAETAPATENAPTPTAQDFSSLFETMCNNLPEGQRKVAIEGQNNLFKELENVQSQLDEMKKTGSSEANVEIQKLQTELDETKKKNGDMQQMYVDNIKTTMQAVKNFYSQSGENPNISGASGGTPPDYSALEGALQNHPELSRQVLPIISCAFTRVGQLQDSLKVHQQESARSAEERELFARMRGFQRDSAKPTCKTHPHFTRGLFVGTVLSSHTPLNVFRRLPRV